MIEVIKEPSIGIGENEKEPLLVVSDGKVKKEVEGFFV